VPHCTALPCTTYQPSSAPPDSEGRLPNHNPPLTPCNLNQPREDLQDSERRLYGCFTPHPSEDSIAPHGRIGAEMGYCPIPHGDGARGCKNDQIQGSEAKKCLKISEPRAPSLCFDGSLPVLAAQSACLSAKSRVHWLRISTVHSCTYSKP